MEQDALRVQTHFRRGDPIQILVDGEPVKAFEGETVAAALLASGRRVLRHTPSGGTRGIFCGMGACFECQVEVDGDPSVRSCVTQVRTGMQVRTSGPSKKGK